MNHLIHNGVIVAQAILVLISPFVRAIKGPDVQDRPIDIIFVGYLAIVGFQCLCNKPSFRLLGALTLIGAYGFAGFVQSYYHQNLAGFMFEAKLFISAALFFCLLEDRPVISTRVMQILFYSFIVSSCIFLVLHSGERLHIVNESNYLCLYVGVAMFSYMSYQGKKIGIPALCGIGIFTLFLFIVSESRTGIVFLGICWLVYIRERFSFKISAFISAILASFLLLAIAIGVALDSPVIKRFEEMKNPANVDRFQYMIAASRIMESRPAHENLLRLSFSEPVSNRVPEEMKWLTDRAKNGTEKGQLYPHHFHAAYLRILMGHGVIPLLFYLVAILLLWRYNRYLSIGLAICSLSMSTPYLTLFFGTLHIAMTFPSKRKRSLKEAQFQNK